jgi:hypothetical protein
VNKFLQYNKNNINKQMKKLLILSMLLMASIVGLISCSKDDVTPTTYTFVSSVEKSDTTVSVNLLEYNSKGELIATNPVKSEVNVPEVFTAASDAETVKVFVTLKGGSSSKTAWIKQVYYLCENGHINIKLADTTTMSESEPAIIQPK